MYMWGVQCGLFAEERLGMEDEGMRGWGVRN